MLLFVQGNEATERAVYEAGGKLNYRAGKYFSALIKAENIALVAADKGCVRIEYQLSEPMVLNDSNRRINNVDSAFFGFGALDMGYTGQGVIMGVIDGGIDFNHGDFKNPDGSTRVLKIWNQYEPFDAARTPAKYGYGQVWDSTDINNGLATVSGQYLDHGCTVTGTAAGNAGENGYHRGVAPGADLVIVSSNFGGSNWLMRVAEAVDYIVSVADSLGKPCVINASLGSYLGSHDGLDQAALYIDSLLNQKPGRIMVAAAGNSGAWPKYHLEYDVTADTAFTWFRHNNSMSLGPGVFFEMWADTADLRLAEFSIAVDQISPSFRRCGRTDFYFPSECDGVIADDTIWNSAGERMATARFYSDVRGAQRYYQVLIPNPDSTIGYRFALLSTGAGHFDLWSTTNVNLNYMDTVVPTPTEFPPIVNYRFPDKRKTIVSSWACSPNVVTVGNFQGYNSYIDSQGTTWDEPIPAGAISKNSSKGPTRDNRTKPDISATGDHTLSAGSIGLLTWYQNNAPDYLAQGGMHVMNGGTSMASPVVAGAAALLLQKCPSLTPQDFKQILIATAKQDAFTGNVPNDTFGIGKINVYRALLQTNFSPTVLGDTVICMPGSIEVNPNAAYQYTVWFGTDTLSSLTIGQKDTLWYQATDVRGCKAWSDTLFVNEFTVPIGELVFTGNWLEMEAFPAGGYDYTWIDAFYGDTLQQGSSNVYWPNTLSFYCVITFANGCQVVTLEETLLSIDEQKPEFNIYPNPVSDIFYLKGDSRIEKVTLYSADSKAVVVWGSAGPYRVPAHLSNGLYMLSIEIGEKLLYTKVLIQR